MPHAPISCFTFAELKKKGQERGRAPFLTAAIPSGAVSRDAMNNKETAKCPRCGEGRLLLWRELSDDEREVARRLPGAADYPAAERETIHRWCTRCWYETRSGPLDS